METLDATIIVTALPAVAEALGVPTLDASLTVTVYLIAMAVFVPAAGWCAERFGARRVFVAALGVFTLASLLCGAAQSIEWLVAARLLQGSAAAFMSPSSNGFRMTVVSGHAARTSASCASARTSSPSES